MQQDTNDHSESTRFEWSCAVVGVGEMIGSAGIQW